MPCLLTWSLKVSHDSVLLGDRLVPPYMGPSLYCLNEYLLRSQMSYLPFLYSHMFTYTIGYHRSLK